MEYKDVNDFEVLYMIKEKDDYYQELMYKKYSPIIKNIASKYLNCVKNRGADYDDLVQEGYIGLSNAINTYRDEESLFYTYATICIERQINRFCRSLSTKKQEVLNNALSDDMLLFMKVDSYDFGNPEAFSLYNFTKEEFIRIKNKFDIEYSSVIAEEKSWPILYHFSHVRENIVNWLPITKKDHVLEIGSGCGAITGTLAEQAGQVQCIELSKKRSMINAYRHREKTNINILLGNFEEIEPNLVEKYDWITLIGVFEYSEKYIGTSEPYKEMLLRTKRHLKPNGKIVIAIENRLGLKYWAGCTEDHVGKYFEGIEGYANTEGIKTFSRKELKNS